MNHEKTTHNLDDLRAMIRDTGLRCTTSRTTVLERLVGAGSPLSHAELADELVPQGFDQATIYRNLIDLTDAGLLTRRDHGDHVWRFEFRNDEPHHDGEHPHFVCTDCGKVSCLPDIDITITPSSAANAFFGEVCEVFLKGRCEQCH